jgi:hypothetical protein
MLAHVWIKTSALCFLCQHLIDAQMAHLMVVLDVSLIVVKVTVTTMMSAWVIWSVFIVEVGLDLNQSQDVRDLDPMASTTAIMFYMTP